MHRVLYAQAQKQKSNRHKNDKRHYRPVKLWLCLFTIRNPRILTNLRIDIRSHSERQSFALNLHSTNDEANGPVTIAESAQSNEPNRRHRRPTTNSP